MTPAGETEPIDIMAGILQGDTLAPFLFIVVLDYVLLKSLDLYNKYTTKTTQKLKAQLIIWL